MLVAGRLEVFHTRQQHAGVAGDGAARLHHHFQAGGFQFRPDRGGQRRRVWWILVAIAHAQTAAHVDMTQRDALRLEALDQGQQTVQRIHKRGKIEQLRADMTTDTDHFHAWQFGRLPIEPLGAGDVHTELVLLESGRNIRVGLGIDVRIHAERYRRALVHRHRHTVEPLQFRFGLHIEAADAHRQRLPHLGFGLADTRENDTPCRRAGPHDAIQLAAGHDVETGTEPFQYLQHGKVGIGLDRIADQMRHSCQRLVESLEVPTQGGARIDKAGRAVDARNLAEADVLGA